MIKQCLQRLPKFLQPGGAQEGQSIIIITFAFLGLLAMLGLALDLGLVYIERVRVSRTADAAALSSVVELPFEEEAFRRAAEFIELNGYNRETTEIYVRGCIDTGSDFNNVSIPIDSNGDGIFDPDEIMPAPDFSSGNVDGFLYQPALSGDVKARFLIDTLSYQPVDDSTGVITTENQENCGDTLYGTASKLRVTGQVLVNMSFMQFFGFDDVPVEDSAVGENVTNLDVVVVFDVSGSMDFETTCFNCWEPYPSTHPNFDVIANPWPTNGQFNPMPNVATTSLCTAAPTTATFSDGSYIVIEAELYSRDVPLHGWDFNRRVAGQGFWVIQRASTNADEVGPESGATSRGAYIRTHPFPVYSQSDIDNFPQLQGAAYNHECFSGPNLSGACWGQRAGQLSEEPPLSNVPWVEYDFTPGWSGNTYVWIRAQGSGDYGTTWNGRSPGDNPSPYDNMPPWQHSVYWQVGPANGSNWLDVKGANYDANLAAGGRRTPNSGSWRWLRLGSAATTQNVPQTMRLYQGTAGFNVDKILFTSYSGGSDGMTVSDGGTERGGDISNGFENLVKADNGRGPEATDGAATREACNVCNPIFGQTVNPSQCSCMTGGSDTGVANPNDYPAGGSGVGCTAVLTTTNQLEDDLYHDKDPIRSAKEAVKNFAVRLDPKFDQIGFVAYSTSTFNDADERSELRCLRWAVNNGGADGVRKCYDPATNPISYTGVIRIIESHDNDGGTHIGQGMREGLEELGIDVTSGNYVNSKCAPGVNDGSVCDRSGAARRVLVLLTDGSPNQSASCPSADNGLWQGIFGTGNNSYDCAIFYSREAANNNVVVYTIGIGSGANVDLMTAMATGTDPTTGDIYFNDRGGAFYNAASPSELDGIFEQILSNIFVRIIG